MAILEEDVSRVRQASDLVEVASEHIALRKVGRRWMGLCPFHAEKTGSFSVNGEEGLYYCFSCQAKGDVITFVREIEHVSFVEAVEKLAARCGIELRYDNAAASVERKRRAALVAAMDKAVDWYHERLNGPDGGAARGYLRERGYNGDIVRQFKIGWAPDAWDELSRSLKAPAPVLKDTGLGFVNRRGRTNDAFRGRIMFPIFDAGGTPVAFGGRVLPGAEGPKYKNSAETLLYSKSRTLYGLNWAKGNIVETGEVIVCEGYTDVIGFFIAGVPRAVATCGTALTEEHVRLLKNFAPRVVLAYDADSAGQAAAERFYEWERRLGIDIVVAALPKNTDPADAARRNPQMLRDAVANATPFLGFRVQRALEAADLRSVEGRARAAERCVAMIAEHPNGLVRDQYLMQVADRCRIPVEKLRTTVAKGEARAMPSERPRSIDLRNRASSESENIRVETEALRLAVHQPEAVASFLDAVLPPSGLEGIEEILFIDSRSRSAFRSLTESSTLHDAVATADPEAAELLTRLAVEEGDGNAVDEFLRLVDRAAQRAIRESEVEARVSPSEYGEVAATVAWLKLSVEQLRVPGTAMEAGAHIVNWLMEQVELVG